MVIAGLGNPGERYAATRHNVGFMVVDQLAARHQISLKKKGHQALYGMGRCGQQQIMLLQPQTFMNLSGASIASACKSLDVSSGDLVVIHDEIDLPLGEVRIKIGGGHGGHNGLRHIDQALSTRDYIRVRVGVDRPPSGGDVAAYVLHSFSPNEKKQLDTVLTYAAEIVEAILDRGVQQTMCDYNGRNILNP